MSDHLAVEVSGLTKRFLTGNFPRRRRVQALSGISFSVRRGQVYGLLGPNGAGKSTTIKVLLGLIRPTSGDARLLGGDPQQVDARRDVGFLPENPLPYEYLTGREFVELSARLGRINESELSARVSAVIERVGLSNAQSLQIRRYSKGMVQRISLAQALVTRPSLLVLDEPTSGLDVLGRRLVRDIILEERARGTTVLFSSHIIPDVEALCDEVALIIAGRLVKSGKVRELLSREQVLVELVLDGLTRERAQSLAVDPSALTWQDERVVIRTTPENVSECVRSALALSARIVSLNPVTYSLEEMFIAEIRRQGVSAVGGVYT